MNIFSVNTLKKVMGIGSDSEIDFLKIRKVDPETLGPKKVFYTWEGSAKVVKKETNKKIGRSLTIIGTLVILLLIIMQLYSLVLLIISLIFFNVAISRVELGNMHFEISSHGISVENTMYYWSQLRQFFYIEGTQESVLGVDTFLGVPGRLYMSFNSEQKNEIYGLLKEHLPFIEKEPRTIVEKWSESILSRFTLKNN